MNYVVGNHTTREYFCGVDCRLTVVRLPTTLSEILYILKYTLAYTSFKLFSVDVHLGYMAPIKTKAFYYYYFALSVDVVYGSPLIVDAVREFYPYFVVCRHVVFVKRNSKINASQTIWSLLSNTKSNVVKVRFVSESIPQATRICVKMIPILETCPMVPTPHVSIIILTTSEVKQLHRTRGRRSVVTVIMIILVTTRCWSRI